MGKHKGMRSINSSKMFNNEEDKYVLIKWLKIRREVTFSRTQLLQLSCTLRLNVEAN
jgi:hypothetical protein